MPLIVIAYFKPSALAAGEAPMQFLQTPFDSFDEAVAGLTQDRLIPCIQLSVASGQSPDQFTVTGQRAIAVSGAAIARLAMLSYAPLPDQGGTAEAVTNDDPPPDGPTPVDLVAPPPKPRRRAR